MSGWIDRLADLGRLTLGTIWEPVLVWTAFALVVLALLHALRNLHPAVHERARSALVLALPISVLIAFLVGAGVVRVPQRPIPIVSGWMSIPDAPVTIASPAGEMAEIAAGADYGLTLPPTFWLGLAVLLAVAASAWLACRSARGLLALGRLKRSLRFVSFTELGLEPDAEPRASDLRPKVRFAVAPGDVVPMTFGTWRPLVVVPGTLLEDRGGLRLALEHELMHVRRRDALFHTLEHLVALCFALHPLVHLLRWEIGRFREMACDAEVLARARCRPQDYAAVLLRLAEPNVAARPPALAMFGVFHQLKGRLAAMNSRTHDLAQLKTARRAAASLGLALLLLATAVVACTDVVSDPQVLQDETVLGEVPFTTGSFEDALNDARANYEGRLLVYFYGREPAVSDNVERYLFGNEKFGEFINTKFARYAVPVDSREGLDIMREYNVTSHTPSPLLMVIDDERAVLMTTLDEVNSPETGSVKMRQILETARVGVWDYLAVGNAKAPFTVGSSSLKMPVWGFLTNNLQEDAKARLAEIEKQMVWRMVTSEQRDQQ